MYRFRAIRLAFTDLWDESLLLVVVGLFGSFLSVLLLPLPYLIGAFYGIALRLSERRAVPWRMLWELAREHLRFFVQWVALSGAITIILLGNIWFYLSIGAEWSRLVSWFMAGLLLTWVLPQPFVPAFYMHQEDQRLRLALRNAAVFLVMDPFAVILLWLTLAGVAVPLAYAAWPLLGTLIPLMALISTRIVQLYIKGAEA